MKKGKKILKTSINNYKKKNIVTFLDDEQAAMAKEMKQVICQNI